MKEQTKLVIIDDDQVALDTISDYLRDSPEYDILLETVDPVKGLDYIRTNPLDILITDVKMPQVNGLVLAMEMKKKNIPVILTSAFIDYTLDAFDLDVIDYLHKPVRFKRLIKALDKAGNYLQLPQKENMAPYLFVKSKSYGPYEMIPKKNILFLKGAADYVEITLAERAYLCRSTMKDLNTKLDPKKFIRVHKSFMINIKQVKHIEANNIFMKNGSKIPIGNSYRPDLDHHIKINSLEHPNIQ